MAANNFNEHVKELEEHRRQPLHNYQQNYTMTQNPEQVSQFQPQFQNKYGTPVYVPPAVFYHYNNTTTSFSPVASPSPSTSSLQLLPQLGCANYNSHSEDKFEDDKSANQQETEENKFLIGSQNILNSLREQQQRPKKKTNTLDIGLLIELVRSYSCIWNVKLNIHKNNLKRN